MSINNSTNPVDIIETTQQLRLRMVSALTSHGVTVPTDPKEVSNLSMLLRDLDAAALTTRKLDVEEKGIDSATIAAANVTAILQAMGGNPFKAKPGERDITPGITPTVDIAQLPDVKLVPGITKIGNDVLDYHEFVIDDSAK
jgi:hypothetical protein